MPFIESFQEFAERQDCPHVRIKGRELFENGAQSNGTYHLDPPTDVTERLRLRAEYVQHLLTNEVKEFTAYRNACLEQADLAKRYSNLPGAPLDAPQKLQAGKARIEALREKLKTITDALQDGPAAKLRKEKEDYERRCQARQAELMTEIESVQV